MKLHSLTNSNAAASTARLRNVLFLIIATICLQPSNADRATLCRFQKKKKKKKNNLTPELHLEFTAAD